MSRHNPTDCCPSACTPSERGPAGQGAGTVPQNPFWKSLAEILIYLALSLGAAPRGTCPPARRTNGGPPCKAMNEAREKAQ